MRFCLLFISCDWFVGRLACMKSEKCKYTMHACTKQSKWTKWTTNWHSMTPICMAFDLCRILSCCRFSSAIIGFRFVNLFTRRSRNAKPYKRKRSKFWPKRRRKTKKIAEIILQWRKATKLHTNRFRLLSSDVFDHRRRLLQRLQSALNSLFGVSLWIQPLCNARCSTNTHTHTHMRVHMQNQNLSHNVFKMMFACMFVGPTNVVVACAFIWFLLNVSDNVEYHNHAINTHCSSSLYSNFRFCGFHLKASQNVLHLFISFLSLFRVFVRVFSRFFFVFNFGGPRQKRILVWCYIAWSEMCFAANEQQRETIKSIFLFWILCDSFAVRLCSNRRLVWISISTIAVVLSLQSPNSSVFFSFRILVAFSSQNFFYFLLIKHAFSILSDFLLHPFRKPKRVRTAFSPGQLLKLEHAFENNQYVVGAERKALAQALNLSETQVNVNAFYLSFFSFSVSVVSFRFIDKFVRIAQKQSEFRLLFEMRDHDALQIYAPHRFRLSLFYDVRLNEKKWEAKKKNRFSYHFSHFIQ